MTQSMTKDEIRREKVLRGNIWNIVFFVAYPILIYNFISAFYSLFDAAIVSSISVTSVSAVSALNQIKNLLTTLGTAVAAGGSVVVARYIGAGSYKDAKKSSNILFSMSLITVAVLVCVCIINANLIMRLSGVTDELIAIGTGYFIVSIIDTGFLFLNSVFMGLQKATANSKVIFITQMTGMILKFSLSLLFIYGLNFDNIIWVAAATLISDFVVFTICLLFFLRKNNPLKFDLKEFKIQKDIAKDIIIISLPIFIGKFAFSFGKVVVNAMSVQYGTLVVGALSVSGSIVSIVSRPCNSFEEIESGLVSQNLGNKNMKRAFRIFRTTLIYNVTIGLIGFCLVKFVFFEGLLTIFTQNESDANNAEFIELIRSLYFYDSWTIIATMISGSVLGLLYGFGQTKIAMVLNISRVFVFRIPILWYLQTFRSDMGAECVGISMGASNLCIALLSAIIFVVFFFKIKKNGYHGMSLDDNGGSL